MHFPKFQAIAFTFQLSIWLCKWGCTCCSCRCAECQKTFQYPSQLQNHMMKHKDIRPYICSECGMEFIQSHHLKQHTLTHKVGFIRGTERRDTTFSLCSFTGIGSQSMYFGEQTELSVLLSHEDISIISCSCFGSCKWLRGFGCQPNRLFWQLSRGNFPSNSGHWCDLTSRFHVLFPLL